MNIADAVTGVSRFFVGFARNDEHKSFIRSLSEKLVAWITAGTVVYSAFGLVVDGKDFLTVRIPKLASYAGQLVLLRDTFKVSTAAHVLQAEFGYSSPCIVAVDVADLDNNGSKTDLVISINNPLGDGSQDRCPDPGGAYPAQYAILKEMSWNSFWPRYSPIQFLAKGAPGGPELPLTFSSIGPFLIGSTYGTDFPGYQIYGYSQGALLDLGKYWASGGQEEADFTEGHLMPDGSLIMNLDKGITRFSLNGTGVSSSLVLTPEQILAINQSVIVLTESPAPENSLCSSEIFANGSKLAMKMPDAGIPGKSCVWDLKIQPLQTIVSQLPCEAEDHAKLIRMSYFPWGLRLDNHSKSAQLLCHPAGEDGKYGATIYVERVAGDDQ